MEALAQHGQRSVRYVPRIEDLPAELDQFTAPGDLAIAFGAGSATGRPPGSPGSPGASAPGTPDRIRVQVRENGRVVVDLQVPGVLAGLAGALPGIPAGYADRVREAIRTGFRGPVIDIRDEDDSGLTITID